MFQNSQFEHVQSNVIIIDVIRTNKYFVAKFGCDTAENEPSDARVQNIQFKSQLFGVRNSKPGYVAVHERPQQLLLVLLVEDLEMLHFSDD